MVLSGTRRNARKEKEQFPGGDLEVEIVTPTHFRCPVSLELMKDPVTLSTGITYDRESIEKWIEAGNRTCPVTNQVLTSFDMIPNHAIRRMIQDWCVENSSHGIERIPTPRIPVSSYEVSEVCSRILSASQHGYEKRCQELVGKIKVWWRESERNKECLLGNGVGSVFANAFDSFSSASIEKHVVILEEILEVLTWMIPIGEESQLLTKLGSESSLHCMVWFLDGKDIASRQSVALLLKEVPIKELAKTEGVVEALIEMVREPIGPIATEACLATIFNLVSSAENRDATAQRFVELGLVPLLLEIIVDEDKGICEKALGVLDSIYDSQKGKEVANNNALTLALAIKNTFRYFFLS